MNRDTDRNMDRDIACCRIGDRGRALSALAPSGAVEIDGEIFAARAQGAAVDADEEIVVMAGDIGGLVVRTLCSDVPLESLPGYGDLVYNSFGDRALAAAHQEQQARLESLAVWSRTARKRQLQIGLGFATVAVCLVNPMLVATGNLASRVAMGLVAFGVSLAWAVLVYRMIDSVIRQFDEDFTRLVSLSSCLALLGSCLGLWAMNSLGVVLGLELTFVAAIAGAAIVPIFAVLLMS